MRLTDLTTGLALVGVMGTGPWLAWGLLAAALLLSTAGLSVAANVRADRTLFDFESGMYEGWQIEGEPFAGRPLHVENELLELAGMQQVMRFTGWQGRYVASTPPGRQHERWRQLREQHLPRGRMTSPPFVIDRPYLRFRMGGLLNTGLRAELIVDEQAVRTAWGNNSIDLRDRDWDVRDLQGRQARIRLVQEPGQGEPSLLRIDDFRLSDTPAPADWAQQRLHPRESFALRHGEYRLIVPSAPHRFASASLLKGPDGRWHMLAVREDGSIYNTGLNNTLLHASADSLHGPWSAPQAVLTADAQAGETFINQVHAVVHNGLFHLFYQAQSSTHVRSTPETPESRGPRGIYLATSPDGQQWTRHPANPLFKQAPFAEDPFVTRIDGRWVMYLNGAVPQTPHKPINQAVLYRTSDDLVRWSDPQPAMLDAGPSRGTLHEALLRDAAVFEHDGWWHLIAGPSFNTFGGRVRYLYRGVWRSRDPFAWDWQKDYTGHLDIVRGGVKVVRNDDGAPYLVQAFGWTGGVWIAPLTAYEKRELAPPTASGR